MNISIPVELKKAQVDLLLGPVLAESYIAVNGKAWPYRNMLLYQEYGRTVLLLERVVDDDGHISDATMMHPITEAIEASPLIIHTSPDGLRWNPDDLIHVPPWQAPS